MTDSSQNEPEVFQPGDPRPVFEGDWQTSTGVQKGMHSDRIRRWRAAQGGVAQSRMATPSGQPVGDAPSPDAATRAVLTAIRDDASAHDSDRIRAAQALIALDREATATAQGPSPLVALRHALETLPPHERLVWLQGERLEGLEDRARVGVGKGA